MRVNSEFNPVVAAFVRSGKKQQITTFHLSDKAKRSCVERGLPTQAQTLRLIRVQIKKQVYILITSLLDTQQYPVQAFKALYHLRWQIEESYKRQKSWLEIENFSGRSVLSVQQDFHARILSLNLTSLAVWVAQQGLNTGRKAPYQINIAQALSTMKDTLIRLIQRQLSSKDLSTLLETLQKALSIIRPGRSYKRKMTRCTRRRFTPIKEQCDYNDLRLKLMTLPARGEGWGEGRSIA